MDPHKLPLLSKCAHRLEEFGASQSQSKQMFSKGGQRQNISKSSTLCDLSVGEMPEGITSSRRSPLVFLADRLRYLHRLTRFYSLVHCCRGIKLSHLSMV